MTVWPPGVVPRRYYSGSAMLMALAGASALIAAVNKAKPASSKGIYLRKVSLSSTMGVGVRVETSAFSAHAQQQQ